MQHSTRQPTLYERERFDAMLRLGCCCLAQLGIWAPAEVHHLLIGNRRISHWYTIPLSPACHRGIWNADLLQLVPKDKRVAVSDGSKAFEAVWGSQRVLWERVQAKLGLPAIWPTSKVLPRRGVTA